MLQNAMGVNVEKVQQKDIKQKISRYNIIKHTTKLF